MRRLLIATFLVSASALGYEILLMRVLSIVQWHHFAYMIISLALLGYGASGTFVALFRKRFERYFDAAFSISALAFAVAMPACLLIAQRVPFNALEIVWEPRQFLNLSAIYLLLFLPFFFAATCIGAAFTVRREQIRRIYFADLLGAGLGAVMILAVLFVLVPQHSLFVLTGLATLASVLVAVISPARRALITAQAVWLALLVAPLPDRWFDLRLSEYKGLNQALEVIDAEIIGRSSSPLGLLTVVASPTVPFRHAPGLSFATRHVPPEQLGVFTDGDAMSAINRYGGDVGALAYLGDTTAALPYALLDSPSVLVLGAGGGTDVLLALYHGARHVDAVELNPQMSRLVAETHADFAGRLYDDPRLALHAREARGFVAQSDARWNLIHIGLLDSFAASGAGVQSLNESYLYTVEGLGEYVAHLEPGGLLAITRWLKLPPRDGIKLFATAAEALRRAGIEDPGLHLAMIRSWNTTTLIVSDGALRDADITKIRAFAGERFFDVVFYRDMPRHDANRYNVLDEPWLHDAALAVLGPNADSFYSDYKFHVRPATDDRPYFFHFFKWASFGEVLGLRHRGGAGLIEWGYLILVATVVQAIIAGLLLVLLPLARVRRSWPATTTRRMGSYFLLLGFAFLFIEIAFIQKFVLFLSHPLYSVAVVLSAFLVFAGIGSGLSDRVMKRSPITHPVVAIVVISALYLVLLPLVFRLFIGASDGVRVAVSAALIAPLAFFMGMPFPQGLKRLADSAPGFIPWAWGINGFASVVAATLATLLAIETGFTVVLGLALAMYAGAAALLHGRSA